MARIHFTAGESDASKPDVSKPVKRMRWATTRKAGQSGVNKRRSLLARVPRVSLSAYEEKAPGQENHGQIKSDSPMGQEQQQEQSQGRKIYVNQPLPPEALTEDGHIKAHFARNKIRTAKYTPLSFIPKNLWFQFHNIANVYFLFIIILSIFSIFGASNPGLGSVPLIFILVVTSIKDAVEDWRRTVLDTELNNSPVYRLVDWNNVNSSQDDVSLWRRIKKSCTRSVISTYRWVKSISSKKQKRSEKDQDGSGLERQSSTATRPTIRTSIYTERTSFHSTHSQGDDIAMTPVPSPGYRASLSPNAQLSEPPTSGFSFETAEETQARGENAPSALRVKDPANRKSHLMPAKDYGSIINPHKEVPDKARFKKDYWKSVQVGDFIRIYNDEQIPADVVVLSTSDPDGACYVETKNLDGETNLKVRQALQAGRKVKHAKDCEYAEFVIDSEGPHPNLYAYSAVAKWQQFDPRNPAAPPREMAEPISINNLLLRGCSLKNTEWVLGVVVFTGQETKIMLNAGMTPSKRARMARELNWNVIYNFIILFFMCLVSGIVQGVTWSEGGNTLDYFEFGSIGGSPPLDGFITFWSAVILFQNLVPISLYITLEIVRSIQAFFIWSDVYMYYEKLDYPCTPKSWNISDDLGQIEYIFSDKTGTLTQNVMEFKKCTINGRPYGEAYTEAEAGMRRRQGVDVEAESARINREIAEARVETLKQLRKTYDNPYLHDEELTFVSPDFVADLNGKSGAEQAQVCEHFMIALALCHTVITETTPGDPPKIEFKAQSPDEAALVATARDMGFTVLGRTNDDLHVNVLGDDRTYRIMNTLEFNSTRKRMSAIVRMPDGKIKLFCKGADSMIYSRLKRGEQQELRKATAENLEIFAREGLRTLCVAERDLDEDYYQEWSKDHDFAAQALTDREDRLEEVADRIERELLLIGGTAIEDRLQDGVPDTIALLGQAGIKLWVLTGDKVETAINIGFSCNLLSNEMDLILFDMPEGTVQDAGDLLDKHLATFGLTGSDEELAIARTVHEPPPPTHALIIDGESLKLVLHDDLRQRFLLLCKQCKSVLCCRVSPAQKAAVVQLVKNGLDIMALSIGDGANDVAMIQEADVGVGIAGEEGRQAAMSSDYAIGQFRFLQRLVLVHGRWSYRRLAESIANFFYKNLVWTFALFWYQIYNNFDISYLFDYTYILLVNLVFTSVPVALMGILDQDVSDKVSLAVPQLYRRGMERKEWTQTKFWLYMADGLYQSAICFFMAYLLFQPGTFGTENGRGIDDRTRMGVFVACSAIVVINSYILMNTYKWDWIMLLVVAISCLLVFAWTGIYSSFEASDQFYKSGAQVFGSLNFWALSLLTLVICLLPRFAVKFFQKNFRPYDIDVVREQVRQGKFKYLDEYEAYVPPKAVDISATSSEQPEDVPTEMNGSRSHNRYPSMAESQRPIVYPPSEAPTRHPHSQTGSDGTDRTGPSFDMSRYGGESHTPEKVRAGRPSLERVRSSFERQRQSFDKLRPSFEQSRDFSSAAMLSRYETGYSGSNYSQPLSALNTRRTEDIAEERR
ncbi:phospholipid transporting ATPase [Exophiala xenobiotica]|nr:phospholipid transporting ATPase [Exophiala xenobiotica]KAK5245983.1 phospholipid transporting ATPase [Exophiala xenobiotica]KAK5348220.1 phospholipid transporting ATPase [Exophiala xenobiotica]KAK5362718.1 phospholipid transporting ATPase [Exophiala xenobiotica]KAK5366025.1 phospholipid transporting ATPase [Exophiala xenobiotica]